MKKKLIKKVEPDGSVYCFDEEGLIQGIVENRYEGKIVSIETFRDNFPHGKTETFMTGGGSETEFFFYGKSVGIGEEGEIKINELNKLDTIRDRFEKKESLDDL